MALKWGTTTIAADNTIKYNNQDVLKIIYNNTTIWEKQTRDPCPACDSGYIECSYCYGSGMCTECKGTGGCSICDGNGYCPTCQGTGEGESAYVPKWCPDCQGAPSYFICDNCGTDVTIYEYLIDEYGRRYRYGSGVASSCGRCGIAGAYAEVGCSTCDVMGKLYDDYEWTSGGSCPTCGGAGGPCYSCQGMITCNYCDGGDCLYCSGRGSTSCPTCKGDGWLDPGDGESD